MVKCNLCGKRIIKNKYVRKIEYCVKCKKIKQIEYCHNYYLKHKKQLLKKSAKWKKENPEKTKDYYEQNYKREKQFKKNYQKKLLEDVIKNPKKYLKQI